MKTRARLMIPTAISLTALLYVGEPYRCTLFRLPFALSLYLFLTFSICSGLCSHLTQVLRRDFDIFMPPTCRGPQA
jgi:hypothetical protein